MQVFCFDTKDNSCSASVSYTTPRCQPGSDNSTLWKYRSNASEHFDDDFQGLVGECCPQMQCLVIEGQVTGSTLYNTFKAK